MREVIEQTNVFKSLETFKKRIYSSSKNIQEITRLYGIADRLGFDYMMQAQKPNSTDAKIIQELISKK